MNLKKFIPAIAVLFATNLTSCLPSGGLGLGGNRYNNRQGCQGNGRVTGEMPTVQDMASANAIDMPGASFDSAASVARAAPIALTK